MWIVPEVQLRWRYLLVASARYPMVVGSMSPFSVGPVSQNFTKERMIGELTAKVSGKAGAQTRVFFCDLVG